MIANSLLFCQLEKQQTPLVNQFYKRVYKKGMANKSDQVFVLKDQEIRCAARLKAIQGALLLTGVACAIEYRGKGLASLLINNILNLQTQDIYCFPYPHLETFYQHLGFTCCEPEQLPEILNAKYQGYNSRKLLLCMVKTHQ
ncbi:GNAT family N-acetyltransferase [Psychromonas algicola]|uniref:GNAT family N-acetyltransferase n=1 Tax=Psychromonas algicola TaxID=2555642 RepID=UPI0010681D1A|nr:GNAT family N-acetyltransferase [Psychromonas sp. RZ5]TEW52781.1 N-acetyltransferase [Psychromonas sp. RZ5]